MQVYGEKRKTDYKIDRLLSRISTKTQNNSSFYLKRSTLQFKAYIHENIIIFHNKMCDDVVTSHNLSIIQMHKIVQMYKLVKGFPSLTYSFVTSIINAIILE